MSNNQGFDATAPSRRSVVKGAAWAVPAIAVASAAPTIAASEGLLTLTGGACKLPGNSQSIFKGYVFELVANNATGPNPRDAIVEVTGISVSGIADLGTFAVVTPGGSSSCSCSGCADPTQSFCLADGELNKQVLIYTSKDVTGNSANATVTVTYQVYDCDGGSTCPEPGPEQDTSAVFDSKDTPPVQGASCEIVGAKDNIPA